MTLLSRCTVLVFASAWTALFSCMPHSNSSSGLKEDSPAVDAPPPNGYAPVFAKTPASFSTAAANPFAMVARINTLNPGKVRIYLNVMDSSGIFYTGLSDKKWQNIFCDVVDEFEGQKRQVKYKLSERTFVDPDPDPHAIALVMDHSGSMGEKRATEIQNAAKLFINRKKDEDAMALIKYDNKTATESELTTSKIELQTRLKRDGLNGFGGYTAIADGTMEGMKLLEKSGDMYKRKVVALFTDGSDNSSKTTRDSVIAFAKKNNIAICAVDFGYGVNADYLRSMAMATGGSYTRIYKTEEFDVAFEDMYNRLRNYYVLEFSPPDYGAHTLRIKLCPPAPAKENMTEIQYDNTPDIGSIALLNVYFDLDKSALKPESKPAMDNISTMLKAFPAMKIEVRGHTDNSNKTKDPDHNKKLSQKRADAVKQELIKRGFAADRIVAAGFGESSPVADNATEEGRALNRRTEFLVLKK